MSSTPTSSFSRNGFAAQLAHFGPASLRRRAIPPAEARSYCRHLALSHYENFVVGSLLLPRALLKHFHHIYAYCRWADDLADETGGGAEALQLLDWWRGELRACYDGTPRHPVLIALRETIRAFDIPAQPFLDLLSAFEQDQVVKRYDTYEQLLDYCRHSANPVGRLVLYLFRCHDEENAALADHICTGLQLANFWQDVARDLDIGRVYLPAEDRRRFGYSDVDLAARRCTPAFVQLMRFEVERARELFRQGMPLVERVPPEFRVDIELFIRGGLGILDAIARQKYDVWSYRPSLGKWKQARLMVQALWERLRDERRGSAPPVGHACTAGLTPAARLRGSYAYCTALARRRAGNFYYAFLVLPKAERRAMCALYAFMRVADDLADEPGPLEAKRAGLAAWRRGLTDALAGNFSHAIHPALVDTVARYGLDPAHLLGLLDGVEQDLVQNRYATFAELYQYCYRVASLVGLCCIRIWGCRTPEAEQWAEWSGIAFQLTNILRDVAEDARAGRVYLPAEDLEHFGCQPEQLREGPFDERYRALMAFEAERAREYYDRARPLRACLPPPGRAVFQIMTKTYRGLLDELARRAFQSTNGPVRLSRWRKLGYLLQAAPIRFGLS